MSSPEGKYEDTSIIQDLSYSGRLDILTTKALVTRTAMSVFSYLAFLSCLDKPMHDFFQNDTVNMILLITN